MAARVDEVPSQSILRSASGMDVAAHECRQVLDRCSKESLVKKDNRRCREVKKEKQRDKSCKPKDKCKKDKCKDRRRRQEKPIKFTCKKMRGNPTLKQIVGSCSHNCCSCCQYLGRYLKETIRCLSCAASPATETQFQEMICDMLNIVLCMGRDCWLFLRYLLRLLL